MRVSIGVQLFHTETQAGLIGEVQLSSPLRQFLGHRRNGVGLFAISPNKRK